MPASISEPPAHASAAPAALEPDPAAGNQQGAGPVARAYAGSGDVAPVGLADPGAATAHGREDAAVKASGGQGFLARPAVVEAPLTHFTEERWNALRAEVAACTQCGLHATRTQTVFASGQVPGQWLVIGEAPGADEDRKGEPFVGRAGQLLDSMLRAIGVTRGESAVIANVLKCRPPKNRDPKPEEVACCLPYLQRQIAMIRPRLILAVGRIAAQNLLATDAALSRLRGRVHYFGELNTPLVVTYHPAYLLRTPADKRKAWEDLKFARGLFRQLAAQGP